MDIRTVSEGGKSLERIPYSCDYWAIMYLLIIFLQVKSCTSLKNIANETKIILHQIHQNYPSINDMVRRYSKKFIKFFVFLF